MSGMELFAAPAAETVATGLVEDIAFTWWNPVTWSMPSWVAPAATVVGAATTLASAGASAYGGYQQGQAQQQAYNYNAAIADQQAVYAQQKASVDASKLQESDRRLMASQRARMAANGLDLTTGSPLVVMEEAAARSDYDYRSVLAGGEADAWALRQQATLNRFQGEVAARTGTGGAATSVLRGATSLADSYDERQFRQKMQRAYTGG